MIADADGDPTGTMARMDEARIGAGAAQLVFTATRPTSGQAGPVEMMTVAVRDGALSASRDVWEGYAVGFGTLVDFFAGMVADWRGWPGARTYESIEHDLLLSATHDGHVQLRVELCESNRPDGWSVRMQLRLDPGEELSRAVADLRAVVQG